MSLSLDLPDGRKLSFDESTAGKVCVGVVCLDAVRVREEPAIWAATEELAGRLRTAYAGRIPSEIAGLREARDLYKSFGMDPSRHRPSSEALLRRVISGKQLYRLNNAVDACNLASLAFLLPIGMYDLDRIEADVVMRVGLEGEQYEGIRKGPVHLTGRLGLFDARGGFGSPTSDSVRTCVTGATKRVLAVVMATSRYDAAAMRRHAGDFAALFVTHCDAECRFTDILGA